MTEILVYDISRGWQSLDTFGEDVAVTIQGNDIASLVDKTCSYTQAIKLPKSTRNNEIFGFLNVFNAKSSKPYTTIPCRVYVDGVELLGSNFRLIVLSENEYYNCQIISVLYDIFKQLDALLFKDLPLANFTYSIPEINAANSVISNPLKFIQCGNKVRKIDDNYFEYAAAGEPQPISGSGGVKYGLASELIPFYNLEYLVKTIFQQMGYTFVSNHRRLPDYQEAWVSLQNPAPKNINDMNALNVSAVGNSVTVAGTALGYWPMLNSINLLVGGTYAAVDTTLFSNPFVADQPNLTGIYAMRYIAPDNYKMKVQVFPGVINTSGSDDWRNAKMYFRILKCDRSGVYTEVINDMDDAGQTVGDILANGWITDTFDMQANEILYVEAYVREGVGDNTEYYVSVDISVPFDENPITGVGSIVYPAQSPAFNTQREVVELFAQIYGLTFSVDENTATVTGTTISKTFDNISIAKDWTNKLDGSSVEVKYSLGKYAQNNIVKSASPLPPFVAGTYNIAVNNLTLPLSLDLMTLKGITDANASILYNSGTVSFTQNFPATGFKVASQTMPIPPLTPIPSYMPCYTYAHNTNNTPYVVAIDSYLSSTTKYRYTRGVSTDNVDVIQLPLGKAFTLADMFNSAYSYLRDNILENTRVIEADFYLSLLDVIGIDLTIPVYLDQFGEYFYIQKISNYIPNRKCKVTLVCLNSTN